MNNEAEMIGIGIQIEGDNPVFVPSKVPMLPFHAKRLIAIISGYQLGQAVRLLMN